MPTSVTNGACCGCLHGACAVSDLDALQIRRAGLMAALSSKTQQNSLLLIDTFTLSQEDAQHCLRHKILDMAGRLKDLETYFVPQKLQRERFYNAIVGDETLLQDEELNARNDDTIADNILQRAIENKEPLVPLFMNTSAFLLTTSSNAAEM